MHVLKRIRDNEGRVNDCLSEMLSEWLKQVNPQPTWAALANAVECVDQVIAQEIRMHCVDTSDDDVIKVWGKMCNCHLT